METSKRQLMSLGKRISHLAVMLALVLASAGSSSAEIFFVVNTDDAIPPMPGSLRAAIQQSEGNGEPDFVQFLIDGGSVELVAPLPELAEGHLSLGFPRLNTQPSAGNGITISGINGVPHAIRVRSSHNIISSFDFVGFTGPEVILIDGNGADANIIDGCVFGRDNIGQGNTDAAIRIKADTLSGGTPAGTVIRFSFFVRNGGGIVIEGDGPATLDRLGATIHDNWFGTNPLGAAGPGNAGAITAEQAGRIVITDNRLSGPGDGIVLGDGSGGSVIADNDLGLRSNDLVSCNGFAGAAIHVEDSSGVDIANNVILCSQTGISVGPGTVRTTVRNNRIGGPSPTGHVADGIVLDGAGISTIVKNTITGSGGFGISQTNAPAIEPSGALISCNAIWNNTAGAVNLPSVVMSPPVLLSSTPIRVNGSLPDPGPGWVEVFGDDLDQARVFQGTSPAPIDGELLSHLIPVLGLLLGKGALGTEVEFDRTTPANHTAALTPELALETTELSNAIASSPGVLYDVIRGNIANLAFGPVGGISLGAVVCLGSDLDPDTVISPTIIDPVDPQPGEGFFYVVRRDESLANSNGTYDPAICQMDVAGFNAPRRPTSGDCN